MNRWSAVASVILSATTTAAFAFQVPQALPEGGKLLPVDGIELYVEERGQGSPVLLLHNFGNSGAGWAFIVPELSKDHRVLLIDLPGHGRSTGWKDQVFDYPAAAKRVFRVLDQLGIHRLGLVGASTGGAVALRMAAEQPARVEALVLVGAFDRITDEATAILKQPGCQGLTPDDWVRKRQQHLHGDDQIRALQRMFCNEVNNPHLLTSPPLSHVKARTLIIHGDHDPIFPPRVGLGIYHAVPTAYLWVVPDGGHLPGFDGRNRSSVVAGIRSFLGSEWRPKY